jgi:hypothetical protein
MKCITRARTERTTVPYISFGPPADDRFWASPEMVSKDNGGGFLGYMTPVAARCFFPSLDVPFCRMFSAFRIQEPIVARLLTVRTEWSRK